MVYPSFYILSKGSERADFLIHRTKKRNINIFLFSCRRRQQGSEKSWEVANRKITNRHDVLRERNEISLIQRRMWVCVCDLILGN